MLTRELPGMVERSPRGSHHYFTAYNIEAFCDLDVFKDNMDKFLSILREIKPAPGHDRVLYPGLSELKKSRTVVSMGYCRIKR